MRTVITGKLTANIGVACIIDDGLARGSAGVLHVLGRCRLGQARTRLRGWRARSCSRLSASRAQVSFPHPPWPPVAARFLIERDPAGPSRTRQVRTELPLRSTTARWRDSHPHHHTIVFATVVRSICYFWLGRDRQLIISTTRHATLSPWSPISGLHAIRSAGALNTKEIDTNLNRALLLCL